MADPAYVDEFGDIEPDVSQIEIEDDEPVDNIFSEKLQQLLVESIYASVSQERRPLVALANVGLFASAHQPPLVPDVMVAFNKEPRGPLGEKRNNTYFTWNYGGPPDIVIEIVSNAKGGEDTTKLARYAEWRVGYYVIYDPFEYLCNRPLRSYQMAGTNYVELIDPYKLPNLGLGFQIQDDVFGGYQGPWLRWCDENGTTLQTGLERAEQESQRAEREAQRADALAEKLRSLGHDI